MGLLALWALPLSSCATAYRESIGTDTSKVLHRVFLTDYTTSWQSVLEAIKNTHLDVSSRESGFIQTKWTDNTTEKNFVDSFGAGNAYLTAQYRLRLHVTKGFYNGQPSVKVSVQKEQLVQRDVLEGWRPIESDSIDENTLLYRIGRIISIRMKLAYIDEKKTQKAIQETEF
jgi:hypothetical protein